MLGYGGQEPHIDYPYWDFFRNETLPTRINSSLPLNAQAIILIDEFTYENGATVLAPVYQKDKFIQIKMVIFLGNASDWLGNQGTWFCSLQQPSIVPCLIRVKQGVLEF